MENGIYRVFKSFYILKTDNTLKLGKGNYFGTKLNYQDVLNLVNEILDNLIHLDESKFKFIHHINDTIIFQIGDKLYDYKDNELTITENVHLNREDDKIENYLGKFIHFPQVINYLNSLRNKLEYCINNL